MKEEYSTPVLEMLGSVSDVTSSSTLGLLNDGVLGGSTDAEGSA